MSKVLLIDFGSTRTKLTAVDLETQSLIGIAQYKTTVDTDITEGFHRALYSLTNQFGNINFDYKYACSSAAGGLKMAAIGLVEELTVEAAKRACFGAGGKVDVVLSQYITLKDVNEIIEKKIDIVLLSGGTDGGNSASVIHNCEMLGHGGITIPIIYAGNRSCQDEIQTIFNKYNLNGYICDNIMPKLNALNIEPAKAVIKDIFMKNIVEAKGINKISPELNADIIPTPQAVLHAAELLSKGYLSNPGLGDIIIVDIGGATTDIYSVCEGSPKKTNCVLKGLEEPFVKRTVEGDLGMRYSATGIARTLSKEQINYYKEQEIDILEEAKYRNEFVDMIPTNQQQENVDRIFAGICTDVSFSRHVGKMDSVYTPLGMMYYQYGKDLTEVKAVIGTGGVIIYNKKPTEILNNLSTNPKKPLELRPKNPDYMVDDNYLLSAMGLLSIYEPALALKIMKDNIKLI